MSNINYAIICNYGMRILDLFPGLRTHFRGDKIVGNALRDLQSRSGRNWVMLAYSLQEEGVQELEQLLEDLTAIVELHKQSLTENLERSEMFDRIAAVRGNSHSKRAGQKKRRQAINLLPTWTLNAGIEELKRLIIREHRLQDALQKADFEGMREMLMDQVDEAERRFTRDYRAFLDGKIAREPRAMSVVVTVGDHSEQLASHLDLMGLTPEEQMTIDRSLRAMEGLHELDAIQPGDFDIICELEGLFRSIEMPKQNFSRVALEPLLKKELRSRGIGSQGFQNIAHVDDRSPVEQSSRWQG